MDADVIIAGCGPAGATAATILASRGLRTVVMERERFPRFQVGESLLPFNRRIFERLGISEILDSEPYVEKYGAEFRTADLQKRAKFSFSTYLPSKLQRAWQVSRAEFDHLLMERARTEGVDVRERVVVTGIEKTDQGVTVKALNRDADEPFEMSARMFLDASGPGSLSSRLGVKRIEDESLQKVAIFAHFEGARPPGEGRESGNIVITILRDSWAWLIPLGNDRMSVGLVVDRDDLRSSGLTPEEVFDHAISNTPAFRAHLDDAERASRVMVRKDFSYRVDPLWGDHFVLLGDAAGFVDPIFSTGVLVAMQSAELAADAVETKLVDGSNRGLVAYERRMRKALGRYRRIIKRFYTREFTEVFFNPQEILGIDEVVIRLLAGNAFDRQANRWKMELFYGLVWLQKVTGSIAPPVPWDTLPGAFESHHREEIIGRSTAETAP